MGHDSGTLCGTAGIGVLFCGVRLAMRASFKTSRIQANGGHKALNKGHDGV